MKINDYYINATSSIATVTIEFDMTDGKLSNIEDIIEDTRDKLEWATKYNIEAAARTAKWKAERDEKLARDKAITEARALIAEVEGQ